MNTHTDTISEILIADLRALVALNRPIESTSGVRRAIKAAMDAGEADLAATADRRLCARTEAQ